MNNVQTGSPLSAVGLRQGTFDVDGNGQATFRLPIEVPPGVNGLAPSLALAYSHRQPNGTVGMGWGISGLSAITRTRATYAVDGFNGAVGYGPDDRFALDGQRLVNVQGDYGAPGTVYWTELQTWQKVTAGATPEDGFTVVTKTGEIHAFGTTSDSRILAVGTSYVRVWLLASITDRNGNRIEFEYTQSPDGSDASEGSWFVSRIRYGGRAVAFGYEVRPDPSLEYVGGYPIRLGHRLASVTVSAGSDTVRTYTLAYEVGQPTGVSLLASVTQAGTDGTTLTPVRMVWSGVTQPGFDTSPPSTLDQHLGTNDIRPMDLTGSGRTDLVQLWKDSTSQLHATTWLATPGASGTTYVRGSDTTLGAFPTNAELYPADVDGDGRCDLVVIYPSGPDSELKIAVYLSDGSGGFTYQGAFATGVAWSSKHIQFFPMDVNGDGRTDIVEAYAYHDLTYGDLLYFRTWISKMGDGSGELFADTIVSPTTDPANPTNALAFWPMDVDGNGMVDLVRIWQRSDKTLVATAYVGVSTGLDAVSFANRVQTSLGVVNLSSQVAFLPVDVNGDGTSDLLQIWQEAGVGTTTLHFTTWLCDGAGGFAAGPDTEFADETLSSSNFYPMDLDGSGSTAILKKWVTGDGILKFTAFRSAADGTFRAATPFDAGRLPNGNVTFLQGDVNGDGKADLLRVTLDVNNTPVIVPYASSGDYPDLATSITNALGGVVNVTYAPLSDATVYTASTVEFPQGSGRRYPNPMTPAQFPVQAVLGRAVYVAAAYQETNDPAINRFAYDHTVTVTYSGASLDLLGRGWQGFAVVTKADSEAGRVTTTTYNQAFPLTGTTASVEIADADGEMSVQSSEYTSVPRGTGVQAPNPPVVEVLVVSARQQGFVAGTLDYTLAHTYTYDDYGNTTTDADLGYVDPTTGHPLDPAAVVYRYRTYQNTVTDTGWTLGFVLYDKRTANAVDPDITQFLPGDWTLSSTTYDARLNRETQSSWDDANGVWLTTTYGYDDYGNVHTEAKPGGFVTTTDWDPDFHTWKMRETTPADAQGVSLTASYGYDPRFGVEVARQDANGFVWITGLDAFGRVATRQGPLPFAGVTPSANACPSQVTGGADLRALFTGASVVTLETDTYADDGQGGLYAQVDSLQAFPTGSDPDTAWNRRYVDGRANDREKVRQTGQSAGNAVVLIDTDSQGRITRASLPFFSPTDVVTDAPHWMVTQYDALGRPIYKETPYGPDGESASVTTWQYQLGEQVTQTDAVGTADAIVNVFVHHFYGGADKVIRVTADPSGVAAVSTFVYDPLGRLLSATDPPTATSPEGVSNTQGWDSMSRRTWTDNPDQNATDDAAIKAMTYGYDATTGQQSWQRDASGAVTSFAFDGLGRVIRRALPDGRTIAYTWDGAGNGAGRLTQVTVTTSDGSVESQVQSGFDAYGNESSRTVTIGSESFTFATTWDPQARVVSQVKPDGTTLTRAYAYGNLASQALDGAQVDYPLEDYTPAQRAGQLSYADGVATSYTFSPSGQVVGETVTNPAGTVLAYTYAYDALAQLRTIDEVGGGNVSTFAYVNRRLQSASIAALGAETATFDASGNLLTKGAVTYTSVAHFATTGVSAGETVYAATRDACGRTQTRTAYGSTLTFTYDGLGLLCRVSRPDGTAVQTMINGATGTMIRQTDADGNAVLMVDPTYQVTQPAVGPAIVTKYLLDDRGVAASVETNSGAKTVLYFRRDFKGSNTHAFDASGALVTTVAYAAWGARTVLSGDGDFRPKYEQKPYVESIGLYYFQSRWYDPAIGRFLTPDTQPGSDDITRQDALNRFSFELGDPINHTDPDGHKGEWIAGLIIGLVAIVAAAAIILSGGAATPVAAVLTGALLGAGLNAVVYSATHKDVTGWKFVGGYVASAAVGAVIGGATAGVSAGLGSLAESATFNIASRAAQFGIRAAIYVPAMAALTSGLDAFNQFSANVIDEALGRDVDLSDGVGRAAITGAIMGAVAGLGQAGAEAKFLKGTGRAADDLMTEGTPLLQGQPGSYGTFEPFDSTARPYFRLPDTFRNRAVLFGISEGATAVDATLEAEGY